MSSLGSALTVLAGDPHSSLLAARLYDCAGQRTVGDDVSLCYEIQSVDSIKGVGMFARRDIQPGEEIVRESPIFCLTELPASSLVHREDALNTAMSSLTEESRASFNSLANTRRQENNISRECGIYATNNLDISSASRQATAIYAAISRINHACVPNARWAALADSSDCVVTAVAYIKGGEEITTSYFGSPLEYCLGSITQKEFLEDCNRRGFECCCGNCGSISAVPKHFKELHSSCTFSLPPEAAPLPSPEVASEFLSQLQVLDPPNLMAYEVVYVAAVCEEVIRRGLTDYHWPVSHVSEALSSHWYTMARVFASLLYGDAAIAHWEGNNSDEGDIEEAAVD